MDRNDEGAGAADDAVLVIDIEIVDIHHAAARPPDHDRQAVDGDAGRGDAVARRHHGRAGIVGAVAGDVDDAAQAAIAAGVEQRLGEGKPARDRGARGAPVRRARELVSDCVGGLRPVDQPPRHQDLLVELARPLEIHDGDLAVCTLAQRGEEFLRAQRLHIALALQRLLFGVHRIGNVDGEDQFDVDRNGVGTGIGEMRRRRGIGRHRQSDRGERGGGKTMQILSPHASKAATARGAKERPPLPRATVATAA